MGLSNAASRARNYNTTINENQGGGNKKAGFAYQVGRNSWSSIYINGGHPGQVSFRCCNFAKTMTTANPNVCISRPIGSTVASNTFFHCPM